MMKIKLVLFLTVLVVFSACQDSSTERAKLMEEVREAEEMFNNHAAEHGVKEAFLEFADEEAVINRNGRTYKGKEGIRAYFNNLPFSDVNLSWEPNFIDVSEAGDMAYTYGPFQFSATDSLGNRIESAGIFHTVWKKRDGSWKFVYD